MDTHEGTFPIKNDSLGAPSGRSPLFSATRRWPQRWIWDRAHQRPCLCPPAAARRERKPWPRPLRVASRDSLPGLCLPRPSKGCSARPLCLRGREVSCSEQLAAVAPASGKQSSRVKSPPACLSFSEWAAWRCIASPKRYSRHVLQAVAVKLRRTQEFPGRLFKNADS